MGLLGAERTSSGASFLQAPVWVWGLAAGVLLLLVLSVVRAAIVWRGRPGRQRDASQAASQAASRAAGRAAGDRGGACDPLTGLVARPEFEHHFEEAALANDRRQQPLALMVVALDNFRPINEGYGHRVGDAVLVATAGRLRAFAGHLRAVSRLAGDEFALQIDAGTADAPRTAAAVLHALQQPFVVEGLELRLTASVGIAVYPEHGAATRLLGHAMLAMRSVKQVGGGTHALFTAAMAVDQREQAQLLQDLRGALARGELHLYYQPKIDASTLQVTAAEALLRWQHPKRGMVSPVLFVPLAERHGLISAIGAWVIEQACRQAAAWREAGLRMRVAVNISGHQLRQDDLVQHILSTLAQHGIPPGRLTCEITESVAMEDTGHTRLAFERLRRAGLHVSIDDFGTGHSSLATLRRLPAAELKIDRAFVTDLSTGPDARSIVQAIVQMAHTLGLRVVAEGVETTAQRDTLVALGCDELQGFLFAKPMTAASLALWADGDAAAGAPGGMFRPSLFDPTAPSPLN